MLTESQKTRKLDLQLRLLGVDTIPVVGSAMQINGVTDRIYLALGLPGGSAYVEFKQPKGKLSPNQHMFIYRARKRGALAVVYRFETNVFEDHSGNVFCEVSYKDVEEWFRKLKAIGREICERDFETA